MAIGGGGGVSTLTATSACAPMAASVGPGDGAPLSAVGAGVPASVCEPPWGGGADEAPSGPAPLPLGGPADLSWPGETHAAATRASAPANQRVAFMRAFLSSCGKGGTSSSADHIA